MVTYTASYNDSRSISIAHYFCCSALLHLDAVSSMAVEEWDTLRPQRVQSVHRLIRPQRGVTFLFPAYLLTGGAAEGWLLH